VMAAGAGVGLAESKSRQMAATLRERLVEANA